MLFKKSFANYSKKQKYLIIFFVLVILSLNVLSVYNKSLMWDEKCYIGSGKYLLKTGNFLNYNALSYHPPLSFYLNSVFLLPINFNEDAYKKTDCTEVSSIMIFRSGYSPFLIAFLARLPSILISVILSFLVLKFAENYYGPRSGIFAMFLYTFSASILSNSNFALTDLLITFTLFLTVFYFWKLMRNYSIKNIFLTGISFGLALLSKITALILVPSIILLAFIEIYKTKGMKQKIIFKQLKILFIILVIGFAVVWAGYGFTLRPIKESMPQHYVERAYQEFDKLPNESVKKTAIGIFEKTYIPAPSYFFGLASVIYRSAQQGREGYFFGKVIEKAPWYYLLVVFLLKTQLSLLLLIFMTIIFFRKIKANSHGKEHSLNEYYLIVPILILFFSFMLNKMVSGVGHILPAYPFLFVFVSKIVNYKSKIFKIIIAFIIIHYFISALLAFPNYYAYFNEFVGSKNGYKYLGDGNLDNGQSLPQLKEFIIENNIQKINLSYLGSVDPKEYGISFDYMPSPYFQQWVPDYKPYIKPKQRQEDCKKRKGWIAVSASNYQGVYLLNKSCYSWLQDYEPVERISHVIFVYNISNENGK